jgi:hypothetical protein
MTLDHWVLYEPIADVVVYDDGRLHTKLAALQVLGLPGTETPVAISVVNGSVHALAIDQVDQLIERLGRARADAARMQVAALTGGAEVGHG